MADKTNRARRVFNHSLFMMQLRCRECGEPDCLELHHVDADDKADCIGRLIWSESSVKRIVDELNKCVPLCPTCHRKLHAGILTRTYTVDDCVRISVDEYKVV